MKSIQKKHTKCSRIWWIQSIMVTAVSLLINHSVYSQNSYEWKDIELIDTIHYTGFSHSSSDNPSYPPSHLFDADYSTCWVAKTPEISENPVLYVRVPENAEILNIFSGYGKSEDLFYKNARPKKVKLSLYSAINPDGYVSETATLYKAVAFQEDKSFTLKDTSVISNLPLDFNKEKFKNHSNLTQEAFTEKFGIPVNHSAVLLKIEILDVYQGSRWEDICISELFFDNRFVAGKSELYPTYEDIYINEKENALVMRRNQDEVIIYDDPSSVLQLTDVSNDNRWAILISMPAEIQGRAETTYLLVDLVNKSVVNDQLEKCVTTYQSGIPIQFEYDENGKLSLLFVTSGERIELR